MLVETYHMGELLPLGLVCVTSWGHLGERENVLSVSIYSLQSYCVCDFQGMSIWLD